MALCSRINFLSDSVFYFVDFRLIKKVLSTLAKFPETQIYLFRYSHDQTRRPKLGQQAKIKDKENIKIY